MVKTGNKTVQLAVRFTPELAERITTYAAQMSKQTPGHEFTMADAIRVLVTKALFYVTVGPHKE